MIIRYIYLETHKYACLDARGIFLGLARHNHKLVGRFFGQTLKVGVRWVNQLRLALLALVDSYRQRGDRLRISDAVGGPNPFQRRPQRGRDV
jgi:hypothetical protein